MNGRIYDPLLGRMLSGDPLVQFPGNLQSYNRYSYVGNNPLSFIDPTGYAAEDEEEEIKPVEDDDPEVVTLEPYTVSAESLKGQGYTSGGTVSTGGRGLGEFFWSSQRLFRLGLDLDSNSIVAVQQSFIPPSSPAASVAAPQISPPSIEPPQLDPSDAAQIASDAVAVAAAEAAGEISAGAEESQSLGRTIAGFVPVLGSTLDAIDAFKKGNVGMGLLNLGLAAFDLTGGGAFVKGALVGGFKLGARKALWSAFKSTGSWGSMRKNLVRNGVLPKRTLAEANKRMALTVDHAFVKQGWGLPHWITNLPPNLNPGIPRGVNSAIEHMNVLERFAELPVWFRGGSAASAASTAVGWGVDSGEE